MANPNNAIGTNAAYGGRTSPNALNDVLAEFQGRGILSGWDCAPSSGMTVVLGGDGEHRDVAIAEDNAGNKTTVDNIAGSPVSLTIGAAPASQSRIDAVVVYINNPPQGSSTETDNYGAVNILDVQGATASTPVAPNDSAIRTAITADGASGATAYYVVLAYITIVSLTTTITGNMIEAGASAVLNSDLTSIPDDTITTSMVQANAITSTKIDWSTFDTPKTSGVYATTEKAIGTWTDGKTIYRKVWTNLNVWGGTGQDLAYQTGVAKLVKLYGVMRRNGSACAVPFYFGASNYAVLNYSTENGAIYLDATASDTGNKIDVILEYTKS